MVTVARLGRWSGPNPRKGSLDLSPGWTRRPACLHWDPPGCSSWIPRFFSKWVCGNWCSRPSRPNWFWCHRSSLWWPALKWCCSLRHGSDLSSGRRFFDHPTWDRAMDKLRSICTRRASAGRWWTSSRRPGLIVGRRHRGWWTGTWCLLQRGRRCTIRSLPSGPGRWSAFDLWSGNLDDNVVTNLQRLTWTVLTYVPGCLCGWCCVYPPSWWANYGDGLYHHIRAGLRCQRRPSSWFHPVAMNRLRLILPTTVTRWPVMDPLLLDWVLHLKKNPSLVTRLQSEAKARTGCIHVRGFTAPLRSFKRAVGVVMTVSLINTG